MIYANDLCTFVTHAERMRRVKNSLVGHRALTGISRVGELLGEPI